MDEKTPEEQIEEAMQAIVVASAEVTKSVVAQMFAFLGRFLSEMQANIDQNPMDSPESIAFKNGALMILEKLGDAMQEAGIKFQTPVA